jgi:O-methyltransferase
MRLGNAIRKLGLAVADIPRLPLRSIYRKYRAFTMIPEPSYVRNLSLVKRFRQVPGSVVECGVWKGGMSAGMVDVAGAHRHYYLFDSFEGCPKAKEIDGQSAKRWQEDVNSPLYYNNSSADIAFSRDVMKRAGALNCSIIKGWFEETLPGFRAEGGIAILRLDGDWYDSTMICLDHLFPQVNEGGVIIIDDYFAFEGCGRALHDYLSRNQVARQIRQLDNDVCFIVNANNI